MRHPYSGASTLLFSLAPFACAFAFTACTTSTPTEDPKPVEKTDETEQVESGGPGPESDFVLTWQIDADDASGTSVTLPTGEGEFAYDVDWDGDGTFDEEGLTGPATHDFGAPGTYTTRIRGRFPHLRFVHDDAKGEAERANARKVVDVVQWGSIEWESMADMFRHCTRVRVSAKDAPNLKNVRSMSNMFRRAKKFDDPIDHWDVSGVTTIAHMFERAESFNQPLSSWDTSKVTSMSKTFKNAEAFNQPLSTWDVSQVDDMSATFMYAAAFDQPLSSWDVSKVTSMRYMFKGATSFNQPLVAWDIGEVTDMFSMFRDATSFDQSLASWDVTKVADMSRIFEDVGMSPQNKAATLEAWGKTEDP